MKRRKVLSAALCVLSAALAAGAAQQAPLKVRPKGRRSVVVTERGRPHALDLTEQIDAMRIESAKPLFVSRAGALTYLLLDVCGLSKVPPDDRQCGAGVECNVVWLKLDAAWRVRGAQNQRYESCWAPVTLEDEMKVEGRRLTFAVEDFRDDVRREVTYDADNPDAGLAVRQTPLPKTNP